MFVVGLYLDDSLVKGRQTVHTHNNIPTSTYTKNVGKMLKVHNNKQIMCSFLIYIPVMKAFSSLCLFLSTHGHKLGCVDSCTASFTNTQLLIILHIEVTKYYCFNKYFNKVITSSSPQTQTFLSQDVRL